MRSLCNGVSPGYCGPPGGCSLVFLQVVVPTVTQLSKICMVSKVLRFPLQLQIPRYVSIGRTKAGSREPKRLRRDQGGVGGRSLWLGEV